MLSVERKGEIAWAVTKRNIIRNMHLREFADPSAKKKEIGNLAQEMGLPKQEIMEFYREMGQEILADIGAELQNLSFRKA